MTVSVVLFDLDDTLFAHRRAVDIGSHLDTADPAELRRWHELEEEHYPRYLTGELGFIAQRRARSRAMAQPYGLALATDAVADAWFDSYFVEYQRAWSLHDDAVPCLDALDAAGYRLGLITNGELAFQSAKLRTTGLDSRLEHVIASGAIGVAKPDIRIFLHACEQFDVPPSHTVYVGDRFDTDARGAAAAGLTGVWLDRSGAGLVGERDTGIHAITSLTQLPALLN